MPVCVLVFLAVPIIAHNDWPMVKVDDTEHNKDETLFSRERRGLNRAEIGQAAIRYLLQGAKYIREQRGYSLYTKKGKYRDALKDFNSLNPSGLRQRQTHGGNEKLLVGTVGDRKIQLLTDKDGKYGMGLSTILLVSNPKKGDLPYKIVYKNKF